MKVINEFEESREVYLQHLAQRQNQIKAEKFLIALGVGVSAAFHFSSHSAGLLAFFLTIAHLYNRS